MKHWTWLAIGWTIVQSTTSLKYSCDPNYDDEPWTYINEEICKDQAEALNEAHERRTSCANAPGNDCHLEDDGICHCQDLGNNMDQGKPEDK